MAKKSASIKIEEHNQKDIDDTVASIKRIAKESWMAALESRGLARVTLVEIDFEMWWKKKLEKSKIVVD